MLTKNYPKGSEAKEGCHLLVKLQSSKKESLGLDPTTRPAWRTVPKWMNVFPTVEVAFYPCAKDRYTLFLLCDSPEAMFRLLGNIFDRDVGFTDLREISNHPDFVKLFSEHLAIAKAITNVATAAAAAALAKDEIIAVDDSDDDSDEDDDEILFGNAKSLAADAAAKAEADASAAKAELQHKINVAFEASKPSKAKPRSIDHVPSSGQFDPWMNFMRLQTYHTTWNTFPLYHTVYYPTQWC